jgi:hypothetical protein
MGETRRKPGDVGPSRAFILVPRWTNLGKAGIKQDPYGNLPSATLSRFRREAGVTSTQVFPNPRKRRAQDNQIIRAAGTQRKTAGVFFGAPTIRGKQMDLGFYSRPKRKRVGEVAQDFALRDDDAVGIRKPMKKPTRAERRARQR